MRVGLLLAALRGDEAFPSTLSLVNLADTKRRNAHLGAVAVDGDIADFERALAAGIGADARAARVAGDAWLVLGPARLEVVRAAYARREPYDAGWRVVATRGGAVREARGIARTTIARDLRALAAPVPSAAAIEVVAARLDEALWRVPVGETGWDLVRADAHAPGARWSCVAEYPSSYTCPSCGGAAFAWIDGDGAVYSGSGRCLGCGASLEVSDAGALAG